MSIVDSILQKLGMKKATPADEVPVTPKTEPKPGMPGLGQKLPPQAMAHMAPPPPATPPTPPMAPAGQQMNSPAVAPSRPMTPEPTPAPKAEEMSHDDLVTHLDYLAKTGPIKGLNWRVSINDFMAMLGMDHSPQAIKDLAVELGCPEKEMMDSYTRNVWTHKALMKVLADNGGNIPEKLLK